MARLELIVDPSGARRGFAQAESASNRYQRSARRATEATGRVRGSFAALASTAKSAVIPALAGGAGLAFAFTKVVRASAQFEKQLVAVGKTTGIEGERLRGLGQTIQDIGQEIPVSTDRLLSLASAAGQLGVTGTKNIEAFTRTLGQLELATDVAGEEGARSLARILNITGEATENVDHLGSALVGLGNNMAATEAEIVQTSTFLASATTQFDLTTQQVLGLSAGLRALGQRSETSGSVVGAALGEINKAIQNGGENLQTLVDLTGKSADQLRRDFQDNATRVLLDFTRALQGVSDQRFPQILEEFGLAGRETSRVINALVSGNDDLREAISRSNEEWQKNTAAQKEAQLAGDSLSGDLTRLSNSFDELLTQEDGMPALRQEIQSLNETIQDPQFQSSFDALVSGFIMLGKAVVGLPVGAVNLFGEAMQGLVAPENVETLKEMQRVQGEFNDLLESRRKLQEQISNTDEAAVEQLARRQLKEINREIQTKANRLDALNRELIIEQERLSARPENSGRIEFMGELNKQLEFLGRTADETKEKVDKVTGGTEGVHGFLPQQRSAVGIAMENMPERETGGGTFGFVEQEMGAIEMGMERLSEQARETDNEMSEFARSAAQNMQSSFADFLFDPMEKGFDGLAESFARTIQRMIAEAAAAEILESVFPNSGGGGGSSGASGLGRFLGGLISSNTASSADGNVFTGPSMTTVSERGHPEAVLPLERQNGKLGVRASGGEGGGQTIVNVRNESGGQAEVSRRSSGRDQIIDILIPAVTSGIQSGRLDGPMRERFGITPGTRGR